MAKEVRSAREWVRTDPAEILKDVDRLGLPAAAEYNAELATERVLCGDTRWAGITSSAMETAIAELLG